jgi:hypothetical protein
MQILRGFLMLRDAQPAGAASADLRFCDRRIATLVAQLRRDNAIVAEFLEERQRRRRELLATHEQELRRLLGRDEAEANQAAEGGSGSLEE